MMKRTSKRSLSWMLVLILSLCFLPVAVASSDSPAVDAEKDEAYTNERSLTVYNAYTGRDGAQIKNTNRTYIKVWYTWDASYNYVYMEVSEENYTYQNPNKDYIYYANTTAGPTGDTRIWQMSTGGCVCFNMAGRDSLVGDLLPAAYNCKISSDGKNRSYEFSFARDPLADGFIVSPLVDKTAYIAAYSNKFDTTGYMAVKYNDSTTWQQTVGDPSADEADPLPPLKAVDGVKESAYTNEKMFEISTAYQGREGVMIPNTEGVTLKTYYYWDDTYVYVWVDVYDPNNALTIDGFYFAQGVYPSTDYSQIHTRSDGGAYSYTLATQKDECTNPTLLSAARGSSSETARSYEFSFAHGGKEGVTFSPVGYGGGQYIVAYRSSYLYTGQHKTLVFDDPSTYTDYTAVEDNESNGISLQWDRFFVTEQPLQQPVKTLEATVYIPGNVTGDAGVIWGSCGGGKSYMNFEIKENRIPCVTVMDADHNQKIYPFAQSELPRSQWVHLALVRDEAAGEYRCYVDGRLTQSLAIQDSGAVVPENQYGLGGDYQDLNASYFKGRLLDVALYNDTRTEAEIQLDKETPGTDGLLAYYDLSDLPESYTAIPDASGNGRQLVLRQRWLDEGPSIADYAYSFAFVGDIQYLTILHPDKLHCIFDWLTEKAEEKKMEFVFNLGDITQNDTAAEWNTAMEQIRKLDGTVPYSLIRGNHDGIPKFTQNVSVDEYGNTVDGSYDQTMLNTYRKLKVGQVDYLLMTLDYHPSVQVINWANQVVKDHPTHNVIITTHSYLDQTASLTSDGGANLWEYLVKKHENIVMVVSGHEACDNVVVSQRQGEKGNTVTQVLIDPQNVDYFEKPSGMITMMYFSADGKNVQVETYSTIQKQWFLAENQFAFELDLVGEGSANQSNPPVRSVYGDANGDDAVDAKDALLILQAAVGKTELTQNQTVKADVNGDKAIDAKDALLVLQKAVDKIEKFPVEQ